MEKYLILLSYYDKQLKIIHKIYHQVKFVDLKNEEKRYFFALKVQQLYTAIEDLFKQVAKSFENHIKDLSQFHKELLARMNTEIVNIRPALLTDVNALFLDKIRSFRHFIRHAYDCELDEDELRHLQNLLLNQYDSLEEDFQKFRNYIIKLSS